MGDRHDRAMWRRAAIVGGGIGLIVHTWMLTAGTWNLFRWERSADFYDAQARSILDGTLAMDQRVLGIESFARGDAVYMYFGPFPALLRLPVIALTDRLDGRLAATSMLLALVVVLAVLASIGWRLRDRVLADRPVSRGEAVTTGALFVVVLGGSSLLFAASRTWVYHEAIVWGVAWTLASYGALLAWLDGHGRRFAVWAAVFATVAMLTRPSVGGGAVAALGLVFLTAGLDRFRAVRRRSPADESDLDAESDSDQRAGEATDDAHGAADTSTSLGLLGAAVLLPVVAYAVVNWLKFRTLFSVPFDRQGFTLISADRRAMLAANGGSLFNETFVPTNVLAYLRPDSLVVDGEFPFVFIRRSTFTFGSPVYDLIDLTAGLPATMPLLAVLAAVGAWGIVRSSRRLAALRPILLGSVAGTVPVLAIGYLANRYQSDFFPLIVIPALAGAPLVRRWLDDRDRVRPVAMSVSVVAVAVVLGAFGMLANASLGYTYQRATSPTRRSQTLSYLDTQRRVADGLVGATAPTVRNGDRLPERAAFGDVFVIGDCAALYWSTGGPSPWNVVQRADGFGGFVGSIEFADVSAAHTMPILTLGDPAAGGSTVFAVVDPDHDMITFGADGATGRVLGPDLPLATGRTHEIDLLADPRTELFELFVGGRLALIGASGSETTIDVAVDIGEAATVRRERIDVAVCRALLDRAR